MLHLSATPRPCRCCPPSLRQACIGLIAHSHPPSSQIPAHCPFSTSLAYLWLPAPSVWEEQAGKDNQPSLLPPLTPLLFLCGQWWTTGRAVALQLQWWSLIRQVKPFLPAPFGADSVTARSKQGRTVGRQGRTGGVLGEQGRRREWEGGRACNSYFQAFRPLLAWMCDCSQLKLALTPINFCAAHSVMCSKALS